MNTTDQSPASTAVFVHGVPESAAIWSALMPELEQRGVAGSVCLSPPGFGEPSPEGWESSPASYTKWLIGELEPLAEVGPIDLVGHDWGGGHVVAAVIERPDLVRSWVTDIIGIFHPDYVWHDMAQAWRTPDVGEQVIAQMTGGTLAERKEILAGLQLDKLSPEAVATSAEALNADMGACILGLYRGAEPEALASAYARFAQLAMKPGLAVVATEDHYVGGEAMARAAAVSSGARVALLEGLGHWWMVEDPARGADLLTEFWATVR